MTEGEEFLLSSGKYTNRRRIVVSGACFACTIRNPSLLLRGGGGGSEVRGWLPGEGEISDHRRSPVVKKIQLGTQLMPSWTPCFLSQSTCALCIYFSCVIQGWHQFHCQSSQFMNHDRLSSLPTDRKP
ncbi:hypothetical protein BS78_05G116300 [Paspalum vaginatum]|nr:hypothetical protein BS78_05G116300 [Paspalum vaginatum]